MALDFDALRKKLNTLQGQNDRKSSLWKPSKGKSVIRILPWKESADNPFIELHFHYMGRKTQLSPLTHGKPDPIAEFADKLASTGDKDDWKYSRQFRPKMRTFVPVIVRGEEDQGVRFWGFGKMVYTQLLAIIADEDWGDITDATKGRDVGIEFIPESDSDTQFAQTKVLVKPNQTPASEDAEQLKSWLETQPDIFEIFDEPSYDDLAIFLERYLNPDSDESVTSETLSPKTEDTKTEETTEKTSEEATTEIVDATEEATEDGAEDPQDVADEFEKLFNA